MECSLLVYSVSYFTAWFDRQILWVFTAKLISWGERQTLVVVHAQSLHLWTYTWDWVIRRRRVSLFLGRQLTVSKCSMDNMENGKHFTSRAILNILGDNV